MTPKEFLEELNQYGDKLFNGTDSPVWSTDDLLRFAKLYYEHEISDKERTTNADSNNECRGGVKVVISVLASELEI